jgi:hypothetical protein
MIIGYKFYLICDYKKYIADFNAKHLILDYTHHISIVYDMII